MNLQDQLLKFRGFVFVFLLFSINENSSFKGLTKRSLASTGEHHREQSRDVEKELQIKIRRQKVNNETVGNSCLFYLLLSLSSL